MTICSMALAACGHVASAQTEATHGRQLGRMGRISSRPLPESTTRTTSQVTDQVLSGWLAAESAFANAARTPDPNAPELAATTIDPQLAWSRSLLERMVAAGQIAEGPVQYGTPRVISLHGGLATVQTCAWDQEIVVYGASGRVAPGIPGQVDFELLTSTMQQSDAGWKMLTQEVGIGQCHRL